MDNLEHAIELDAYLVSDYPGLVKMGDYLFKALFADDEKRNRSPRERFKSKETLKLILINLYVASQGGVALRYSRRPAYYTRRNRYGQIYFKFDRVIPIIDKLIEAGYLNSKEAVYDKKEWGEFRRQPRIWASDNLVELFNDFEFGFIQVQKDPPKVDELIVLKNEKKEIIDIDLKEQRVSEKDFNRMLHNVKRYNDFIPAHKFEVKLPGDLPVRKHFLRTFLLSRMTKGIVKITGLSTDSDVGFRINDDVFPGFEINRSRYIINPNQADLPRLLPDVTPSNYNEYYRLFVLNRFIKNPEQKDEKGPSPASEFTGRFLEYFRDKKIDDRGGYYLEVEKPLSDWGIRGLDFECLYQYLHRPFNEYLDSSGGRFYDAGLIQDLPRKARRYLYINDSPAVELDYGASHFRLLYHQRLNRDLPKDPYQGLCETPSDFPEERKLERGIYKIIILVMINAKDEQDGIWGSINKLALEGYPEFCRCPEFIECCLTRVKKYHPDILIFLNKKLGNWFQYLEGCIADVILTKLAAKNIPCYPIHDSYMVPEEFEDELHQLMVFAYQEVVGTKFFPVIDKKTR